MTKRIGSSGNYNQIKELPILDLLTIHSPCFVKEGRLGVLFP